MSTRVLGQAARRLTADQQIPGSIPGGPFHSNFILMCVDRARLWAHLAPNALHPALIPPPALDPAPPLPFNHKYLNKYRVHAPGGCSIVASEVSLSHGLSQRTGGSTIEPQYSTSQTNLKTNPTPTHAPGSTYSLCGF